MASLRKKLAKDSEIHRADNVRIMQVRVVVKMVHILQVKFCSDFDLILELITVQYLGLF